MADGFIIPHTVLEGCTPLPNLKWSWIGLVVKLTFALVFSGASIKTSFPVNLQNVL